MNKVELIGRLTRDPEVRYGKDGMQIGVYTLAVGRRGKKNEADFINCVTFGKGAEFAEKYFHKGLKVAVIGRIRTGSFINNEGKKVYTVDVVVEDQEFCEKKEDSAPAKQDGFMSIPGIDDEGLPFN